MRQTMTLISLLKTIRDPRSRRGRRHELWLVMFLSLLGDLCGYRGYRPLATFARNYHARWCQLLGLAPAVTRVPSYSTFRQVFLKVNAQAWVEAFNHWAASASDPPEGHLAIDGKAIRCTRRGTLHSGYDYASLVSAYSQQAGVVQLSLIFNKQVSEIATARDLIAHIAAPRQPARHSSLCFSLDALHAQVETLALIDRHQCQYVVGLKGNQKKLYRQVQQIVEQHSPFSVVVEDDNTHGRNVTRRVALYYPDQLDKRWQPCNIAVIIHITRQGVRDCQPFCEHHYYLSNRRCGDARRLGQYIREHWRIENNLHWVKDVALQEDFPPRIGGHSPISWAILNTFLITVARQLGTRTFPQARRQLANQLQDVFRLLT